MLTTPRSFSRAALHLDGINAIGWKLLVVRAEIGGGKTERATELVAFDDRAEDGEFAPEKPCGAGEIARFDGAADERAADDLAIDLHRRHTDFREAEIRAEAFEQREIAGAAFAKRPLEADADFAQRARGGGERADEILGRGRGECVVEGMTSMLRDAEIADEPNLVRAWR